MFGNKKTVFGIREYLVKNILLTYAISWFWVAIAVFLMQTLMASAGLQTVGHPPILSVLPYVLNEYFPQLGSAVGQNHVLELFMVLIFAPVIEEVIFRLFPLTLVQRSRPEVILAVQLAICGIIFGYVHGSPFNIFIQGVLGFMLGRLYIANATSMAVSWGSCAIVHFMYNLTVVLVWP